MNKEELEKEADEYSEDTRFIDYSNYALSVNINISDEIKEAYLAGAEPREKRISKLEAQIEKMKNCKNCANYMISGKCPCLFRTGWCKNWELAK